MILFDAIELCWTFIIDVCIIGPLKLGKRFLHFIIYKQKPKNGKDNNRNRRTN